MAKCHRAPSDTMPGIIGATGLEVGHGAVGAWVVAEIRYST